METDQGVSEELRMAAEAHGPKYQQPAYVRAAFPLVALPRVLRGFVMQVADALGVAPECIATPAIATCATAIGNTCRIRLKASWTEPCVIWAVTLMESGSLKTPAYNAAVAPLRMAQKRAEMQFQQAQDDYHKAKALFEAGDSQWVTPAVASQPYAGEQAPTKPKEPKPVDLYTSDSTVEAVGLLLGNNPRGLALTRDELSGFFASFGAYKGGKGGDEATYLECYNAGAFKVNRASGKRIFADSAALSIFGTCQPSVFMRAIGADGRNTNQVENGLAARFLIAAPEPRTRCWTEDKPYDVSAYQQMITDLLRIDLKTDAGGNVEPTIINMRPDAQALYASFINENGQQAKEISNAALRYHYAKLEAVAARLALIFYLCDFATKELDRSGGPGVQQRHILSGIAIARWYGREAYRVYEGCESVEERERRELLELIKANRGVMTIREMRNLRRRWRDPEIAELALKALVRAGYGSLTMPEVGPVDGRPSLQFTLYNLNAVPGPSEFFDSPLPPGTGQ